MKTCRRCGQEKPHSEYHRHPASADRLQAYCKACMNAHRAECGRGGRYYRSISGRASRLLKDAKVRSAHSGAACTITQAWIKERLERGRCEATGLSFSLPGQGQARPFSASLDRKDRLGGYTPENTQVVCWAYNAAKGAGSAADVLRMAQALVQQHQGAEG